MFMSLENVPPDLEPMFTSVKDVPADLEPMFHVVRDVPGHSAGVRRASGDSDVDRLVRRLKSVEVEANAGLVDALERRNDERMPSAPPPREERRR